MRGVIVSKLMNATRYGVTFQSELDPNHIRMWLLHWDRLEYPIGGIDRRVSPDEQFLIESGVMQRTLANEIYRETDHGRPENGGLFDSTLDTFALLERQQPGVWSIARTKLPDSPWDAIEPQRSFEQNDLNRGLYVRLISAVPVPNRDTPLAEILSFKERRNSELLAFRAYVEDIYSEVLNAPDRPLAELRAVEGLQKAARDIAVSQPHFSWNWCDLSGKFNLVSAAVAAVAAHSAGLGILPTVVAAAAGASIEVGPSFALKGRTPSGDPFEYVASYHREL